MIYKIDWKKILNVKFQLVDNQLIRNLERIKFSFLMKKLFFEAANVSKIYFLSPLSILIISMTIEPQF